MRGVFDDEEPEPVQHRHDTEFTLNSAKLIGIVLGLVLVCGLCFGLGYVVGRRGSQAPAETAQAPAPAVLQVDSSRQKPSATVLAAAPTAPESAATDAPAADADSNAAGSDASSGSAAAPVSTGSPSQVRPALVSAANIPSAPLAPAPAKTEPAIAPASALLVQIAAVSHQEDADVLANALRKRGYAVTARREATDGLIHVRVGPFKSRDEANQWRQKLLNDGYNAIVQP